MDYVVIKDRLSCISGNEQDFYIGAKVLELFSEFSAAQVRHYNIGDQKIYFGVLFLGNA